MQTKQGMSSHGAVPAGGLPSLDLLAAEKEQQVLEDM